MSIKTFTYNGVDYYLSKNPTYPLEIERDDNAVIESPKEAGYRHARARFTKNFKSWLLHYEGLSDSDKITLESLFDATRFAVIITWYNTEDGQTYNVQIVKPFPKLVKRRYNFWDCDIVVRMV